MHSYPPTKHLIGSMPWVLRGPVVVEEKIDGAQFSFGVHPRRGLELASKNARYTLDTLPSFFGAVRPTMARIRPMLKPGAVYRGEYLRSPKPNVVAYDRVPAGNLILWDVEERPGVFVDGMLKRYTAAHLGLEAAPVLAAGVLSAEDVEALARAATPLLGGPTVEGVVVKGRWGRAKFRL